MNNYLRKNISIILLIFLYLQPVIDIITSITINIFYLDISFGMLVRFLFLLFILYFYLFVKKGISKKKKIYLISVLLFIISFSLMIILIKDLSALSYELSNILKIFYFTTLLIILDEEDIKITINDIVKIACIYLFFVSIPTLFNISFESYAQGKVGNIGWFNSGNEISAILSLLTPFIIHYLFDSKNNLFKKIIISLFMIYSFFIMGSKVIIISLFLSLLFEIILLIKKEKNNKNKLYKKLFIIFIIILLSIILIPQTNFYKNIILHLSFLNINGIKDIFNLDFINRFIFSDRLTYLSNTNLNYIWSKLIEKFLGLGYIESYGTDFVYMKAIEMDLFDIFYRTGIIGFIIFILPLIDNIKSLFKNSKLTIVKFSVILGIIISLIVGHTLVSPGVSIFLIYYLKMRGSENT